MNRSIDYIIDVQTMNTSAKNGATIGRYMPDLPTVYLDGIDSYLGSQKQLANFKGDDFTILINCALVETGTTPDDMMLVDNRDERNYGFAFFREGQSKKIGGIIEGENGSCKIKGEIWDDCGWHFHTFRRCNGQLMLQTDLNRVFTEKEVCGKAVSAAPVKIGRRSRVISGFYKGHIGGAMQIFSRSLTDMEVESQYRRSFMVVAPTPSDCIMFYNLIRLTPGYSFDGMILSELKTFLEEILGKEWLISQEKACYRKRLENIHPGLSQWLNCVRHANGISEWSEYEIEELTNLIISKFAYEKLTPKAIFASWSNLMQNLKTEHYFNYIYALFLASCYSNNHQSVELIKELRTPTPDFVINFDSTHIYCEAKKLNLPHGRVALSSIANYLLGRIRPGHRVTVNLKKMPNSPMDKESIRNDLAKLVELPIGEYSADDCTVNILPWGEKEKQSQPFRYIEFRAANEQNSMIKPIKRNFDHACKQLGSIANCPSIIHIDVSNHIIRTKELKDIPSNIMNAKDFLAKEIINHSRISATVLTWSEAHSQTDSKDGLSANKFRVASLPIINKNAKNALPKDFKIFEGTVTELKMFDPLFSVTVKYTI